MDSHYEIPFTEKLFFYGSDNFIVKSPMVMIQTMHCLQQKCTKIDFLLVFDKILTIF